MIDSTCLFFDTPRISHGCTCHIEGETPQGTNSFSWFITPKPMAYVTYINQRKLNKKTMFIVEYIQCGAHDS